MPALTRQPPPTIVAEYHVVADATKRISLRNAKAKYFNVQALSNQQIKQRKIHEPFSFRNESLATPVAERPITQEESKPAASRSLQSNCAQHAKTADKIQSKAEIKRMSFAPMAMRFIPRADDLINARRRGLQFSFSVIRVDDWNLICLLVGQPWVPTLLVIAGSTAADL
jgi:hypothetical protein